MKKLLVLLCFVAFATTTYGQGINANKQYIPKPLLGYAATGGYYGKINMIPSTLVIGKGAYEYFGFLFEMKGEELKLVLTDAGLPAQFNFITLDTNARNYIINVINRDEVVIVNALILDYRNQIWVDKLIDDYNGMLNKQVAAKKEEIAKEKIGKKHSKDRQAKGDAKFKIATLEIDLVYLLEENEEAKVKFKKNLAERENWIALIYNYNEEQAFISGKPDTYYGKVSK